MSLSPALDDVRLCTDGQWPCGRGGRAATARRLRRIRSLACTVAEGEGASDAGGCGWGQIRRWRRRKVGPMGNPADYRRSESVSRRVAERAAGPFSNYLESLLRPAAAACREHLSLMSEAKKYLRKAADFHPPWCMRMPTYRASRADDVRGRPSAERVP